jgi:hypothetical protein
LACHTIAAGATVVASGTFFYRKKFCDFFHLFINGTPILTKAPGQQQTIGNHVFILHIQIPFV